MTDEAQNVETTEHVYEEFIKSAEVMPLLNAMHEQMRDAYRVLEQRVIDIEDVLHAQSRDIFRARALRYEHV